jgi:hypothetical protein
VPHWPRPLDELDRILGADPDGSARGALGCYEPTLPRDASARAQLALASRYRERWNDYWGEVGDALRLLEADGVVVVDRRRGALCDARTGDLLTAPPAAGGST